MIHCQNTNFANLHLQDGRKHLTVLDTPENRDRDTPGFGGLGTTSRQIESWDRLMVKLVWLRVLAASCILPACCPRAFALNPALDASQYAHTSWKIRDGFTKGRILSIAQTPDGYLCLGTEFGLLRFDGVRTVPWQPPPGQDLPSSYIGKLLAGRDGTLWIGTLKGLASWKDGKLTRYPEFAGQSVRPLLEDREGALWVAAFAIPHGKLCAIQSGKTRCYGEDGRFGPGVYELYEDSSGNLWGGGLASLWRLKPGPPKLYPLPDRELTPHALIEGDDGAILIALRSGMRQLVNGKTEAYPLPGAVRQVDPGVLLRDRNGGLWIGTDAGLIHVHQGRTDVFDRSDGLSGNAVGNLYEDREGNIWVTTYDGGLDRFRDLAVATISVKQGLSSTVVDSVLAAKDGSVWLSTIDGLNSWKGGQITIYRKRSAQAVNGRASGRVLEITGTGLPDDDVESAFQDASGRIWAFTLRGAAYLDHGRFVPISGIPGRYFRSVAEDATGNLWVSHDQGLFHLLGEHVAERIPWAKLGRKDWAISLLPDSARGGLWLGFSQGGVAFFKDGEVHESYAAADGLGQGIVGGLQLDPGGTLWAATESGLSRLRDGRIATLTSKNGLPCDTVHWVMEDDNHSFWLFTVCGLIRIARSELDAWENDPKRTLQVTVLDSSDGVMNQSVTIGSLRVAKSADGKLWFVAGDGVSVFDPRNLPFNKLPPPVHIEAVKNNGKESAPTDGIALSRRTNDLEIDYTALSLSIPERIRFRYKLEGKDAEWQDAGTRRQAYYGGLRPKNYRFRVIACNNDGVWNEAGATWNFSIVPAFYQTAWFVGLCVLAGAGVLWLLYRLRLRQMAARLNLLHAERLAERTRIARDLHDTLLQSLAGVSLQLDGISKRAAPETASLIGRVRDQVNSAFREARIKVWNLRSPALDGEGLPAALREFVDRIAPSTKARCRFTVTGEPRPCPPEVEEELLRIAQEAANNASRHAQASEIHIGLEYTASSLTLSISDDGTGFDLEQGLQKSGHWGLKNMQERAAQIRGNCNITTAVGRGTQIEIRVPLSSQSLRNTLAKHAHSSSGRR